MTDTPPRTPLPLRSGAEETFPTLTAAQMARIALHGTRRPVDVGQVLLRSGEQVQQFFVVMAGRIEIVRESATGEELVIELRPGQFSGEASRETGIRMSTSISITTPASRSCSTGSTWGWTTCP